MCPPGPPTCPPLSLYSPEASRRLCAILRPAGGIFVPVFSRAGEALKHKTSVKAIYRPITAFCALMAIPIFPSHQVAHSARHAPIQGTKQPRPAPPWSKPGYYHLFRAMDSTAQRSLSASHQAQRGPVHRHISGNTIPPLARDPLISNGQIFSRQSSLCVFTVVPPPESPCHSRLIVVDP